MGTIDLDAFTKGQPELQEKGIVAAICHISLSLTLSAGDVHRIGKIPHGAIPLDAVFYPGAALAAGAVAKFGTSASQELFFASATFSQAAAAIWRCTKKLGTAMQISVSDDAQVRYDALTMVGTAGISVGAMGDLVVYYRMPGQNF